MRRSAIATLLGSLAVGCAFAGAQSIQPEAVPLAPGLLSFRGTDAATGIQFVRFIQSPESAAKAPLPESGLHNDPDFMVECTELHDLRTLSFYLVTGSAMDIGFMPPFQPKLTHLLPPKKPSIPLKMTFNGYIHSKPFKRFWEKLPHGNYEYSNPGMRSANLDGPRYFLQYLNSLPVLHLENPNPASSAPGELSFQTTALLQQILRGPLCQP